jgi:hypothetical protein
MANNNCNLGKIARPLGFGESELLVLAGYPTLRSPIETGEAHHRQKPRGHPANLKGWQYILTYGLSLDVYARGNQRICVERGSNEVVLRYVFDKKSKF